MVLFASHNEN